MQRGVLRPTPRARVAEPITRKSPIAQAANLGLHTLAGITSKPVVSARGPFPPVLSTGLASGLVWGFSCPERLSVKPTLSLIRSVPVRSKWCLSCSPAESRASAQEGGAAGVTEAVPRPVLLPPPSSGQPSQLLPGLHPWQGPLAGHARPDLAGVPALPAARGRLLHHGPADPPVPGPSGDTDGQESESLHLAPPGADGMASARPRRPWGLLGVGLGGRGAAAQWVVPRMGSQPGEDHSSLWSICPPTPHWTCWCGMRGV